MSFAKRKPPPQQQQQEHTQEEKKNHVDLANRGISSLDLTALTACGAKERNMLAALHSMSLSFNSLRELPRELSQLLPRLANLEARNNLFSASVYFPRTLVVLDVSQNQLSSITDLIPLTQLRRLNISENRIMSLGVLRRIVDPFPQLVELKAAHNWIKSLRGLECVAGPLEFADFEHNAIAFPEDLAPLQSLAHLKEALLRGNPVVAAPAASSCASSVTQAASSRTSDRDDDGDEVNYEQEQDAPEEDDAECDPDEIEMRNQSQQRQPQKGNRSAPLAAASVNVSAKSNGKNHNNHNNSPSVASNGNKTQLTSYASAHQEKKHHEQQQSKILMTESGSSLDNDSVLLDFERRANESMHDEVQRLQLLLRETRSSAAAAAASARAMKETNAKLLQENEALRQQLQVQKQKEKSEAQRFQAKLRRLTEEHQRVAVTQEAELEELRLELATRRQQQQKREQQLLPPAQGVSPPSSIRAVDPNNNSAEVFEEQLRAWVSRQK